MLSRIVDSVNYDGKIIIHTFFNRAMPTDVMFRVANTCALLCWIALILLPRWRGVRIVIAAVIVGGLCVAYAALIFVYFFRVEGGGFSTLAQVQRLFESPHVALAGWLHYLAFDLFVGLWIAQRSDAVGLSRWMQAPTLGVTFMFGPIGLLLYAAIDVASRLPLTRKFPS